VGRRALFRPQLTLTGEVLISNGPPAFPGAGLLALDQVVSAQIEQVWWPRTRCRTSNAIPTQGLGHGFRLVVIVCQRLDYASRPATGALISWPTTSPPRIHGECNGGCNQRRRHPHSLRLGGCLDTNDAIDSAGRAPASLQTNDKHVGGCTWDTDFDELGRWAFRHRRAHMCF